MQLSRLSGPFVPLGDGRMLTLLAPGCQPPSIQNTSPYTCACMVSTRYPNHMVVFYLLHRAGLGGVCATGSPMWECLVWLAKGKVDLRRSDVCLSD